MKNEELEELERRFHAGEAAPQEDVPGPSLLAQRLARRRGYGIAQREGRPRRLFSTISLIVLALLGAWGLAGAFPALRYWMSKAAPIDVGRLGAYRPQGAPDGSFVRVEDFASPRRGTYSRLWRDHEVFALVGSRILVDRAQPADDSLRGFGFRYRGEGRIQRLSADPRYDGPRQQLAQLGELPAEGEVWVIEDGIAPRRGWRAPLESGLWTALTLVCCLVALRRAFRS